MATLLPALAIILDKNNINEGYGECKMRIVYREDMGEGNSKINSDDKMNISLEIPRWIVKILNPDMEMD